MKIDRLIGIISVLLQQKTVAAPYLAEKFEVSRRTINRDIEVLENAGIPIYTTQGVNGGISISDGYKIDKTLLTSSDMQAILTGLRSLDSISGTNRYAQLMTKLSVGCYPYITGDRSILIDLDSWKELGLSDKIEKIQDAVNSSRRIRFEYYSPHGESIRDIEPYYLIFKWSSWYVMGWCTEKRDYRLFKLSRITNLSISELFEKKSAPYPDFTIDEIYPNKIQVKAIVSSQYKWQLIEKYGESSFCEQPDGNLLFESDSFFDNESVILWALSLKDGVTLIEPKELRKELQSFGKALNDKYSEND